MMKKKFYFSCVKLGEKKFWLDNTFFLQKTGNVKWSVSSAKPYFSVSYTQHVFVSCEIKIHLGSRTKRDYLGKTFFPRQLSRHKHRREKFLEGLEKGS